MKGPFVVRGADIGSEHAVRYLRAHKLGLRFFGIGWGRFAFGLILGREVQ